METRGKTIVNKLGALETVVANRCLFLCYDALNLHLTHPQKIKEFFIANNWCLLALVARQRTSGFLLNFISLDKTFYTCRL